MMIAVVIPAFKTRSRILDVIEEIGPSVKNIYVVDDGCPQDTGKFVLEETHDKRIQVIFHNKNLGVGAAMLSGYKRAISDGNTIIVKIDSDGQMNPQLIHLFTDPIANGEADYTKGNRFSSYQDISAMPKIRIFGNMMLSLITKFSCGYWNIFDPTNGFTAIHYKVASELVNLKISKGYFFESDILFWLYIHRAKVKDIPMKAVYHNEVSSLNIARVIPYFIIMNIRNFFKRLYITYLLRDFSIYSLALLTGSLSFSFGIIFGLYNWNISLMSGITASSGTVMLAALPIILGLQLIIYFISFDITNYPKDTFSKKSSQS